MQQVVTLAGALILLTTGMFAQGTQVIASPWTAEECVPISSAVSTEWSPVNPRQYLTYPGDPYGQTIPWDLRQYIVRLKESSSSTTIRTRDVVVPRTDTTAVIDISPPAATCVSVSADGTIQNPLPVPPTPPVGLRVVGTPPPALPAAAWTTLIATTGAPGLDAKSTHPTTVLDARGFDWKAPFDEQNGEVLVFMSRQPTDGSPWNGGIYSDDIVGVSARTGAITPRIDQPVIGDELCLNQPTLSLDPPLGHPRGDQWYDPVTKKAYFSSPLCQGNTPHLIGPYNALTRTMDPLIHAYTFPNGYSWNSGTTYVASYRKAIVCCGDVAYRIFMWEFDSMTNVYSSIGGQLELDSNGQVDLSKSVVHGADGISCDTDKAPGAIISDHCPVLRQGMGTFSDGSNVWMFGGFNNAETQYNDLYRYEPVSHTFTKMVPSGLWPPASQTAMPMCAADTRRNRLVCLLATNDLWAYAFSTNTWSKFTASGESTVLDNNSVAWSTGRSLTYDPVQDAMIAVQSRGQSHPPDVRKLQFSGQ